MLIVDVIIQCNVEHRCNNVSNNTLHMRVVHANLGVLVRNPFSNVLFLDALAVNEVVRVTMINTGGTHTF